MINQNPYNLPDKVLKPNISNKPITLQSKKSRDLMNQYSVKQIPSTNTTTNSTNNNTTSKGITVQSHMKKSLTLQHIISSPNLHNHSSPTSATSNNRHTIQFINRGLNNITHNSVNTTSNTAHNSTSGIQYHSQQQQSSQQQQQYPIVSPVINQQTQQFDKKLKFLFDKFYHFNQQLISHDGMLQKLTTQMQYNMRSSMSPQVNGGGFKNGVNNRQKLQQQSRSQSKSTHSFSSQLLNTLNQSQGMATTDLSFTIESLKKDISQIKQQVNGLKSLSLNNFKQPQSTYNNNNINKPKLNSNYQQQIDDRKQLSTLYNTTFQQISKINQSIDQLRVLTHQKIKKLQTSFMKSQGNIQLLGHRANKNQQRIQTVESNIQRHMNLVNQQINTALGRIVGSINEKIQKALEHNLLAVNQKLKKNIQTSKGIVEQYMVQQQGDRQKMYKQIKQLNQRFIKNQQIKKIKQVKQVKQTKQKEKTQSNNIITGTDMILRIAGFKSELKCVKFNIQTYLKPYNIDSKSHNIISESLLSNSTNNQQTKCINILKQTYFIDSDGYILDENQYYLLDSNNMMIKLDQMKINQLKNLGLYN